MRRLGAGGSGGAKGLWREIRGRLGKSWEVPAAEVVGPCIEALRFRSPHSPAGQILRALVVAACDPQRRESVHPAYASSAARLADDEVRLFYGIAAGVSVLQRTAAYDLGPEMFYVGCVDHSIPLESPTLVSVYLDHLRSLNLLRSLAAQPPGRVLGNGVKRGRGYLVSHEMSLTEFGHAFAELIAPELEPANPSFALRFPLSENSTEETLIPVPLSAVRLERLRRSY
jgi:hypothetical protein